MSIDRSGWYVYAHTVEGLFFKALRARITPPVAAQLKELGIDLAGKPREVPHLQWKEALVIAASLFEGTDDQRFRQIGQSVLRHYEETVMGRAVVAVMRILGPTRIFHRVNQTLRSANNYIVAEFTPAGERAWDGIVNECNGNPHYIAGVLEQGLIISGAKEVDVAVRNFDGHAAMFSIRWG
jgi:uncharacterized protein (TIGR02265 family)